MERTQEEKEKLVAIVDSLGPLEFFSSLQQLFGARRAMQLTGWAVVWGALGVEDVAAMRMRYEEAGMSERSAYRAAVDFRRFGDYLLGKYGRQFTIGDMVRGLAGGKRDLT